MTTVSIDNFESGSQGVPPAGWTISVSDGALTDVYGTEFYAHTGSKACWVYNDVTVNGSYTRMTKSIDLTNATNLKLWVRYASPNMADPMANPVVKVDSTVVWSETGKNYQDFTEVIADVSGYTGFHNVTIAMECP
jgi:hypothetical protein